MATNVFSPKEAASTLYSSMYYIPTVTYPFPVTCLTERTDCLVDIQHKFMQQILPSQPRLFQPSQHAA
jgi:hypothetical protein